MMSRMGLFHVTWGMTLPHQLGPTVEVLQWANAVAVRVDGVDAILWVPWGGPLGGIRKESQSLECP